MSRHELKYLVGEDQLPFLRQQIEPFVEVDPHVRGFEGEGYTVRSIYLDTAGLRYYREKKAGIRVRRKLRVRAYNAFTPGDWVFLEIKRKVQDRVSKNRAPLLFESLDALFRSGDVEQHILTDRFYPASIDDAKRFFYHVYKYDLIPVVSTVYEREAFIGRYDPTLRITFDRNLRGRGYPRLTDIYDEGQHRLVKPGSFVIEVKYNTGFPRWLRAVLGRYGLRTQAVSKYCLCAETSEREGDRRSQVLGSYQAAV